MTVANALKEPRPRSERSERGKGFRVLMLRKAQGDWVAARDRLDPVNLLAAYTGLPVIWDKRPLADTLYDAILRCHYQRT